MRTRQKSTDSREEMENCAADFLQRRRFGSWSEADQAELDAWLDESPSRKVAFLRLEAGLDRAERLAALRPIGRKRRIQVIRLRYAIPYIASVASLSVIVALGIVAERYFLRPADRTFSTDVGGHTLVNFADGTQMTLNTDTLLLVRMTSDERTVWLERGEAYFHVAHDAAHPFSVIAGNHRISDLGTEFAVRRSADGVEVALVSGRAALSNDGAQTATLTPGDEAVATSVSMSVTRKTPQELADELAWQRGVIVLRHTKLDDAAREFNRYNRTKLVIDDPGVAEMTIGGDFKADNLEDFLRLTQTVLNLRARRDGNDILLTRAPPKSAARSRQE
jgi:transmembrane sensor